MKFDFVDIGTCDFNTSADEVIKNPNAKVLLIEPLKFYLDRLPNHDNILKANIAIGERRDTVSIFYIEEKVINEYKLPDWLKGCNSLGRPHWLATSNLEQRGLDHNLIKKHNIDMITFSDLCERFDLQSIGRLTIDTEGYDHLILPEVYKMVSKGFKIDTIIFEYQPYMGNTAILDIMAKRFEELGYKKTWPTTMDVRLDKC
jgi:FkbM family methyltransferase